MSVCVRVWVCVRVCVYASAYVYENNMCILYPVSVYAHQIFPPRGHTPENTSHIIWQPKKKGK